MKYNSFLNPDALLASATTCKPPNSPLFGINLYAHAQGTNQLIDKEAERKDNNTPRLTFSESQTELLDLK